MGETRLDCRMRGVNPSDEGALVALVAESMDDGWGPSQIAAALVARGARVRLVETVRTDPMPLAFLFARRIVDVLEIDLIGVRPGHRRRGMARWLLETLIAEETGADLAEVRLELAASNEAARSLYEGLGFVVVGRRSRYYPDGEDALLLARSLREGTAVR